MNLQTQIRPELWQSISSTYEAKNYSAAVLDAMHHVSNLLRDKTGADGDGVALVGQAFGGDSPRLRVNKLQTETEKNIQKGIEQILRGLYLAIRNPRSHEQIEDSQSNADSIICFVDYLLGYINQSEEPFTVQKFLDAVLDSDFVASHEYARLLASEIPINKRLDTLIEIYRHKSEQDGSKLAYIVLAITNDLNDDQKSQFLDVVSEELRIVKDETTIRRTLQILPPQMWKNIREIPRLRIENKLVGEIKKGQAYANKTQTSAPLGTWAQRLLPHFTIKIQAAEVLLDKLEDVDENDRRYVTKFFMGVLPVAMSTKLQQARCINVICTAVRNGDVEITTALINHIDSYPSEWQRKIVENLKDLTDSESPAIYLSDGTPFLKSEELPF